MKFLKSVFKDIKLIRAVHFLKPIPTLREQSAYCENKGRAASFNSRRGVLKERPAFCWALWVVLVLDVSSLRARVVAFSSDS